MAIFHTGNFSCNCKRLKCDVSCSIYSTYVAAKSFCEEKPKTNAEWIRAMNNEELGDFLSVHMECESCPSPEKNRMCGEPEHCGNLLINWLGQEANCDGS